ncbi:MAG TPA: DUF4404 family protein [Gemmataceae bacterium]|nr:DUF4404 family protein [Gemmataceae bacterium]
MSEPFDNSSIAQVRMQLRAIAQLLRAARRLEPDAKAALADLIDELSRTLETPDVPSAEIARLTECTAHLVKAVQEQHEPSVLEAARGRLDHAVVAVETEAPGLASVTRRLAEMLSNIGI